MDLRLYGIDITESKIDITRYQTKNKNYAAWLRFSIEKIRSQSRELTAEVAKFGNRMECLTLRIKQQKNKIRSIDLFHTEYQKYLNLKEILLKEATACACFEINDTIFRDKVDESLLTFHFKILLSDPNIKTAEVLDNVQIRLGKVYTELTNTFNTHCN